MSTHELSRARAIVAAAERHDGVSPVSDQAMLAAAQGQRTLLLFDEAGRGVDHVQPNDKSPAVALGIVGEGEVDLVVLPEHRGHGLGAAVLAELVARGSGSAPAVPLRAWAHGENPAAHALLTRAGFSPVRSLLRMVLDPALLPTDGPDPAVMAPPANYRLRNFNANTGTSGDSDAAQWVRVNAAAFADHPEQGRMTVSDFQLIAAEEWFDAADLFLVTNTEGVVVASTWIKRTPAESELYAIGVHPDHAGHGLGRFMLDVTLARMAQQRPHRVSLYVDGENSRAVRMYSKAGFTIDSRSQQWQRPALSAASARMEA